jgi:hypothetical protein
MADKVVEVPGVGNVAFPDTMSDGDIGKAIQTNYQKSMPPIPKPADPILNGPEMGQIRDQDALGVGPDSAIGYHGFDQPMLDTSKIPLMHALDPNSTNPVSQVVQHTARFAAGLTTPKNMAIAGAAAAASPAAGALVEAAGPALGYTPEAVSTGAQMAATGVHRVLGGYFGAMGAKGAADSYSQGVKDYMAGKPIAGDVTDTALNAAMAGAGLRGLLHTDVPTPTEVREGTTPAPTEAPQTPPSEPTPNTTPPSGAGAFDLLGRPTDDDQFSLGAKGTDGVRMKPLAGLLPASVDGTSFAVRGEELPPQQAEAAPMSPEAEAISQAAAEKATPPETPVPETPTPETPTPEPQAPQVQDAAMFPKTEAPAPPAEKAIQDAIGDTEGLGAQVKPDKVSQLEDSIRTTTGQLLGLNDLLKGNAVHMAADRAIADYQSTVDPRAKEVSPGISPDDQKMLSIAMGEKVGSVLTPDQAEKAYALKGFVKDENGPKVLQNRGTASKARVDASRAAIAEDLKNPDLPVDQRAKLEKALQSDSKMLYEPARKNVPNVDLNADHPEAPFRSQKFGAPYPDISLENVRTVMGKSTRSVDMGMGDPELKAQLKGQRVPQQSREGVGTVNENTEGFSYDKINNPKGINGDARYLKQEIREGAVKSQMERLRSQLRDQVNGYQNLRDKSKPSELVDQVRKLAASRSIPKELNDLVKPDETKAGEKTPSAPARKRITSSATGDTNATSPRTELGKAKANIGNIYSQIQDKYPEHLKHVQGIIQEAADRFGHDTDGAVVASYHALTVLRRGIADGDEWAYKNAIKEIMRRSPQDPTQTVSGHLGQQLNMGVDPKLAKGVLQSARDLKNYVMPEYTPSQMTASADYASDALLSRYERMTPTNRSAYRAHIHSDELDRLVNDGDPDNSKGYQDRLNALRKSVRPTDLYGGLKDFTRRNEQQIMADDTGRMIRAANGERYVNDLRMETVFNKFNSMLERWSNNESRDFIDKMERKEDQGDPLKNHLAEILRTALDEARNRITAVNGNFQEYLENYFPHIWANVGKGQELSKQMRGMSGNESFTKNRELDTFDEGIRQGLQPVTYNPLRLVMMRVEQMNRYAMKEQLKQDFITSKKATLIKSGEPVPDGLVPLEDRAFEPAGGLQGRYFAPEPVARIFNRFTSKGLAGKGVIPFTNLSAYDALRSLNNGMNQFQLGISGLHGTFTATNSILSEATRGITKALNGDVSGGMQTLGGALNVPQRYFLGKNLIAHLKDPQTFQDLSDMASAFQRAGGRVGTDKILGTAYSDAFKDSYKNAMDDALSGNARLKAFGGVVKNGVGAALELAAKPIMEHLVPNLKIGQFAKMANEILSDNEGRPQAEIDGKLQQAWDTVDDRFGQMVYDNLFWPKVAKDIAMLTTRAPGWNIGTYRAGIGGLTDLARSVRDAKTKGQRIQFTDRTVYLATLAATTMAIGGLATSAMTGTSPHGADYFFPRTGSQDANGEDNRVMPKLYTYDYINAARDPLGTALHKVSPLVGTLAELHANKNFYGREIYDQGSSVPVKLAQMAAYAVKSITPFSLSNYNEQRTRGGSLGWSAVQSIFGILPAPKWAGRSAAENLAEQYYADDRAQGGEAGDLYDQHQKYVQLQAEIRNGTVTPDELQKRVDSGEIPGDFIDHAYGKEQTPNLERWVTNIRSPQRAMEVWDKATPEERERLGDIMAKKMDHLEPAQQQAWADKLNNDYHPDTHVFSVSQWKAAHPGEDENAAEDQARKEGYEVHP